jgi:mannose/cellobiose epimerase-like protein (N-acyl-D-glucosamine 2-epimerase family)
MGLGIVSPCGWTLHSSATPCTSPAQYYCEHLVDPTHGAWFRILDRQNRKYDELQSPPGKADYHTMGACYTALEVVT